MKTITAPLAINELVITSPRIGFYVAHCATARAWNHVASCACYFTSMSRHTIKWCKEAPCELGIEVAPNYNEREVMDFVANLTNQ